MIDIDSQELQAKCINKILVQNMNKLNEYSVKNKLSYLLWFKEKTIIDYMSNINLIYKIIDLALEEENYKKALRYTCLLDKNINEVIELVSKKEIQKILL